MNRRAPLIPCPFCRSTDIRESVVPTVTVYFACHKCGASGPMFPAGKMVAGGKWPSDAARDAWNSRP